MTPAETPADRFRAAQGSDTPEDLLRAGLAYAEVAGSLAERLHVASQLPGMTIDMTMQEHRVLIACLRTAGRLRDREGMLDAYEASLRHRLARDEWNQVRVQWWILGFCATIWAHGSAVTILQALLP